MNNSKCMPKIIRKELNVSTCLDITKITTKLFLTCKTCLDNCTQSFLEKTGLVLNGNLPDNWSGRKEMPA
jgi:hypothetical protein